MNPILQEMSYSKSSNKIIYLIEILKIRRNLTGFGGLVIKLCFLSFESGGRQLWSVEMLKKQRGVKELDGAVFIAYTRVGGFS